LQACDVAFISVGGALLGVFVGSYCTYRFSLKAAETQARKIAGAKLWAAFAPEIAKYDLFRDSVMLTAGGMDNADKLFKDALPKHAAAIEEYRWFIPSKNQPDYQKAWEDYKNGVTSGDYWEGENRKNIFKQKVEAIFKFIKI